MTEDPWASIKKPDSTTLLAMRRVSAESRWNFYWAKDQAGKCLLVMVHDPASTPIGKLPRPRGLSVELTEPSEGHRALLLKLLDGSQRDIFLKLATDIMTATEASGTEPEAVSVAVARTWRWHHLLKGGGSGKLGDEEQKGLIGELLVLKRHLLPQLSPLASISAWRGPLGAPKDFEVGRMAIEAKARRGSATPFIRISSEHQLDASGCDRLFLHVVELDRAIEEADPSNAISIAILADDIRGMVYSADRAAIEMFEACLISAGVTRTADYEDDLWVEGRSRAFDVVDGFPRITPDRAGSGVRGVQYSVDLAACEPFAILVAEIANEIGRHRDV
ncbi:hypothetical protein CHU93_02790 [Sandarakinorhabdus cyanobacteriorum]|uniref:PD-(D/E)XK motif protein n=1 Tax=Sandarakinorhabdus cyanobacteriorum TaxID=1981098 RepID=A0A255YXQ1_9SPHN|nr:PD-(D/E)XK motif protein [Sandarakinorhabdus cyanobacteriorum]OYQ33941.1 hypothetical protein CHU93_02790 [Sandarakinorhabdus cyanobacteriorum]